MEQKIVGAPCEYCGTPLIQGKKGVYCKPRYIEWKNRTDSTSNQPVRVQSGNEAVELLREIRDILKGAKIIYPDGD